MQVLAWIGVGLALLAAILFLPPLLSAMPRRSGGGLGPALGELNAAFTPAERHVQAAQQTPVAPERKRAEPPPLAGVCPLLQVYDMMKSLAFYQTRLGLQVLDQSPRIEQPYPHIDWVMLGKDEIRIMLNTAYEAHERPPVRDLARTAAHRDVRLYFDCADLDAAFGALTAQGLEIEPPRTAPYGMRQRSFADPDGYLICLQQPV